MGAPPASGRAQGSPANPDAPFERISDDLFHRSVVHATQSMLEKYPALVKLAGERRLEETLGPWALVLNAIWAIKMDRDLSVDESRMFDAFTKKLQDLSDQLQNVVKPHRQPGLVVDIEKLADKAFRTVGAEEILSQIADRYLYPGMGQLMIERNTGSLDGSPPRVEIDQDAAKAYMRMTDIRTNGSVELRDVLEMLFGMSNLLKMPGLSKNGRTFP